MTTKNPAPTATNPVSDRRVQPDGPLSGEVKRGGEFTLDTSGHFHVMPGHPLHQFMAGNILTFDVLDVFTQGYIEALFAGTAGLYWAGAKPGERMTRGFSDLAPETLARIIADCGEAAPDGGLNGYLPTNASAVADARGAGAEFWRRRNKFTFKRFPPLTAFLGDDGKVRLREPGE